jgi:outer membrane protein OmpA-like peptidoglycan-associated protein
LIRTLVIFLIGSTPSRKARCGCQILFFIGRKTLSLFVFKRAPIGALFPLVAGGREARPYQVFGRLAATIRILDPNGDRWGDPGGRPPCGVFFCALRRPKNGRIWIRPYRKFFIFYPIMKTRLFSCAFAMSAAFAFAADLTVTATSYDGSKPQAFKTITLKGQRGASVSATTNAKGVAYFSVPNGDTYAFWCEGITGEFDCSFGNHLTVPHNAGDGAWNLNYDDDKFELKGVTFETGKATLKKSSYKALQSTVEGLTKVDTVNVQISGHTDNQGGMEFNQKLSEDRANAVRDYLISKGIAANRITAVGYGYSSPVASNDTEAGRAKNRRIEIGILP